MIPQAINILKSNSASSSSKATILLSFLRINYKSCFQENFTFCCGERKLLPEKSQNLQLCDSMKNQPTSIESLWVLAQWSYFQILRSGKYIENWQFYANQILGIEKFYGYLLWGSLYIKNKKDETVQKKGLDVLTEVICNFPKHPEPYIVLWEYFTKRQQYSNAYAIITEGFIRAIEHKNVKSSILIILLYVKSLLKHKKYIMALELLQEEYAKNPKFLRYLYIFGKICIKSDLFKLNGTGLGALKEVKRHVKNDGKLYYWLAKACFNSGRLYKSEKYFTRAKIFLQNKLFLARIEKKLNKIQQCLHCLEVLKNSLQWEIDQNVDKYIIAYPFACESLKLFNANVQINLKNNDEALKILKKTNNIESFKLLANVITIDMPYENANQILSSALKKLKNSEIPTYELVSGCKKYSKFLVKHKKLEKAFLILKSLLKFYPEWEVEKSSYNQIKESNDIFNSFENDSEVEGFSNDFCTTREFVFNCIESKNNITEDISSFSFRNRESVHRKVFSFENIFNASSTGDENNLPKAISPQRSNDWVVGFSIYTKPNILLTLAKVAAMLPKCHLEAIKALKDFLALSSNKSKKQEAITLLASLNSE